MSFSIPQSCSCPITKSLVVTFDDSEPPPDNGYIVKWRVANSNNSYTEVFPNPTSSPVTILNVPACEDIEVVMQSQCANSEVSAEDTLTANAMVASVCGDDISGSHTHNGYYSYAPYLLDVRGAASTITLTYDAIDRPNAFSIYDAANNRVGWSDWRGTAAYGGPWGTSSLNTPTTGQISFTKAAGACFYKLVVESLTNTSTQDSWTACLLCPSTGDPEPTIKYLSCNNGVGSYEITAPANTSMKIALVATGYLTDNTSDPLICAQLQGTITSSTGPSDSENSATVSTLSLVTIGTNNTLFVNVVVPGTGYLVINTILYAVNSLADNVGGNIKIFEVNGVAKNILQPICAYSTTGVVTCTSNNYNATKIVCSTCSPASLEGGILVSLPTGVTGVLQNYYVAGAGSPDIGEYVYRLESINTASTATGAALQNLSATTCSAACALGTNPGP